jgi:polyvinyl alcohol dehydrogenase (cytochrome)
LKLRENPDGLKDGLTGRITMKKSLRRLATVACWVLFALAGLPSLAVAAACTDTIDRNSPIRSDGFAQNLSNTRNTASAINSGNVGTLQLALNHIAAGSTEKRGAPAVTNQAIFLSAGNNLVAINRVSGCQYWSYAIPARIGGALRENAVRSSSVYLLNVDATKPALVLAGDAFGNFYAVDAVSGKLAWSRFVGYDADLSTITGGVQFYDGKLLVPVASKEVLNTIFELVRICCTSHGQLQAIDPYTGAAAWTYDTSGKASYQKATRQNAPSGMSIWGVPAIDTVRRNVYVGTGQNLSQPATDNSDSILALDFDTGRVKWIFQSSIGDAWNAGCEVRAPLGGDCPKPPGGDFDFGAPPILAKRSGAKDAIIAGAKNGVVYSLDPDTGALNWQRKIGRGGNLGGVHWGMTVDGSRVYVAVSDVTVNKATAFNLISLVMLPPNPPPGDPHPGVYALDLATGAVLWQVHTTHPFDGVATDSIYSAAVSMTNDVVFASTLDGLVKALRSSDGKELWSYNTAQAYTDAAGNSGNGGTIDSVGAIVAGNDVLVNSGYDTFGKAGSVQAGPGNALLVFRLPGG